MSAEIVALEQSRHNSTVREIALAGGAGATSFDIYDVIWGRVRKRTRSPAAFYCPFFHEPELPDLFYGGL